MYARIRMTIARAICRTAPVRGQAQSSRQKPEIQDRNRKIAPLIRSDASGRRQFVRGGFSTGDQARWADSQNYAELEAGAKLFRDSDLIIEDRALQSVFILRGRSADFR